MEIKRVGVIGSGLMGAGIAQVAAAAGFETIVRDVSEDALRRGNAGIEKSLAKFAEKEEITADEQQATLARLKTTTALEDLRACDLVIEAIVENLEAKQETFRTLDALCPPATIFASNTSSLSITEMMTSVSIERRTRFIGLHFFSPVPLMRLVEIVRTILTDDTAVGIAQDFVVRLGKQAVEARDRPGFIVNRLLVPYLLDAVRALEEGVGSIADIDAAMRLGCNHPIGPLALADFVGLDTAYYIAEIMFDEFRERRFAPPPLLKRMVLAGFHGRKSGSGFYNYADPKNPVPMKLT